MGFSLTLPSWAIGTFIPTQVPKRKHKQQQKSINIKEAYASPNSSTKPQTTK
jgi:hypothetical protein